MLTRVSTKGKANDQKGFVRKTSSAGPMLHATDDAGKHFDSNVVGKLLKTGEGGVAIFLPRLALDPIQIRERDVRVVNVGKLAKTNLGPRETFCLRRPHHGPAEMSRKH